MTEPRNQPSIRPSDYLDSAVTDMIAQIVDTRMQTTIEKTLEHLNQNPPEWFTTEINGIKTEINGIKTEINAFKEETATKFDGINTELNRINTELNGVKTEINGVKSELNGVKSELNGVKSELNGVKTEMKLGMNKSEFRHNVVYNTIRRMSGQKADIVPFLRADIIQEDLPPITSVEDIDDISKRDCQSYLRAYNVQFSPQESVKLKERLRSTLGLLSVHDVQYNFRGFS